MVNEKREFCKENDENQDNCGTVDRLLKTALAIDLAQALTVNYQAIITSLSQARWNSQGDTRRSVLLVAPHHLIDVRR